MNGYKIIDFKGIDVSQGATVPGVYNAIITANKPLVFYNLNLTGESALLPFYAGAMNNDGGVLYFTIEIATADGIVHIVIDIDVDSTVTVTPIS